MRKEQGLTLIELLVVISILLIIIGITIQSFRYLQGEEVLSDSAEKIINILRLAQSRTLASEDASQYGVYFDTATDPHQYILFKPIPPLFDYATRDINSDEVHEISKAIEMYNITLVGEPKVVFSRLTGETANSGTVSLRLKSDNSKTRTVSIQSSGKITLGVEIPPSNLDDYRIKDSRHVHFDLGWSIQNATALKFYFPNTSETKTVDDIVSHFDAGKTEFDWEGTFSIGAIDQIFRIHTHSLDIIDTLLCIHRDRNNGGNNQEVIIYIVDSGINKDIAHYLADSNDTVNLGAFGGSMEVQ